MASGDLNRKLGWRCPYGTPAAGDPILEGR